jgi:AraC family L-rhamnose operon transcriptional activator RhaR/AraC family L-rhamnose operon regulatory protein RhaS
MLRILKTSDWFHADGFPITVERRQPQEPFGPHAHEFSELVLVTGGKGLHVTGAESWPLAAGDVFVISGNRPHHYDQMQNLCLINILFQPKKLQVELVDLPSLAGYHALFTLEPAWRKRHQFKSRLHLAPQELGIVTGLVDQLDQELKHRSAGFAFMATALFMQIVGYLSRCYGQSRNPDSRALLRIAETITHLETNYDKPINLDDLAKKSGMSKRSFLRTFRAATDHTPIAYLIQLRINRAINLLRSSNESITEIAFKVGFSDSNYFTRQFRKITGNSPRAYRRQTVNIAH